MNLRLMIWLSSALLASAPILPGTENAVPRLSGVGVYAGYSAERFDGYSRTTELVAVRDGARLAVTVYRPTNGGAPTTEALPVLFSFTPYLTRRVDAAGLIVGVAEADSRRSRAFADLTLYGYVVAVADVRGKGSSFGVRAAYADRMEGQDGHDLVEWLAAQPWSSGKVGMFGCSYVGGTQWSTARNIPPHLRAIFPQAAQFDSYRNVRRGGITGQFNTRPQSANEDAPTVAVDADRDGSLRAAALRQHQRNGQMSDLIANLPFRDDRTDQDLQYWMLSSPYPRIAEIKAAGIAVYSWGNWMDEPADQSLIGFENVRDGAGLAKLLMGPGGHCDTDTVDSFVEHLRFFDHVLKGVSNGIDREPPITFKTSGLPEAEAWRQTTGLPLSSLAPRRYFLRPDATLGVRAPQHSRPARYDVTYRVGCQPPAWAMPVLPGLPVEEVPAKVGDYTLPQPGYWACVNPRVAKHFVTEPMREDMWLSDFSIVSLTLTSSAPEAYVFGYLEDVAPDGGSTLIAHGRLLGSQRKLGAAPYRNLGLPWTTGLRADAAPLEPGRAATLMFELSPTSRIIPSGHSLRLSFTGADQRQRDMGKLAVDPPPTWILTTGGPSASYVDLHLAPVRHLLASTQPLRAGNSR